MNTGTATIIFCSHCGQRVYIHLSGGSYIRYRCACTVVHNPDAARLGKLLDMPKHWSRVPSNTLHTWHEKLAKS